MHARGPRVGPERASAIARARADFVRAAGERDVDAILRHLAADARLIVGRDTLILRNEIVLAREGLRPGAATRLWLAGSRVRVCDRWLYESGGELGFSVDEPGVPPSRGRFLYSIAWTIDSAGNALVQTLAMVNRDYGPPSIEGCRANAQELFERRRVGMGVLPGGAVYTGVLGRVENAMREQSLAPRLYGDVPGYGRRVVSVLPPVASVWVRVTPKIWLEALGSLATVAWQTSGMNPDSALAVGVRLEQRWAAATASLRWRDIRIGVGPAFVREAWHVSAESVQVDTARGRTFGPRLAGSGNTLNRVGLFSQGSVTTALSGRSYIEFRAYLLLLPQGATPPAFALRSVRVNSRSFGMGLLFGVGF